MRLRESTIICLAIASACVALACEEVPPAGSSGPGDAIQAPGFDQGEVVYYEDGVVTASEDAFCADQVVGEGCVGAGPRVPVCGGTTVADVAIVDDEQFDVLCYATGEDVSVIEATHIVSSINLHGTARCEGCYSFDDADVDHTVDDGELRGTNLCN
jgi:hypothetical protein